MNVFTGTLVSGSWGTIGSGGFRRAVGTVGECAAGVRGEGGVGGGWGMGFAVVGEGETVVDEGEVGGEDAFDFGAGGGERGCEVRF